MNEGKNPLHMGRLWYTSGIEGFISTMETSSLMGSNVARLIVDGLMAQGKQDEKGADQNSKAKRGEDLRVTEEL